jgi:hypothetical protein
VKVRVPISGTVGKAVFFDPEAGARAEAAVAALAAQISAGIGGSILHSSLRNLQVGDDHPQYTGWQFPETIVGQWNFQTIPRIQGETLAEYIEEVVGGSFFDFLQDTTSVVWTYHDTAGELEANVPPEFVQDVVGLMATDSTSIDFTYNDLAGTLTAATINANPSGLIGMTAVNGTAATPLRSDGRHAIDPAIAPTWTNRHQWNGNGNPEMEIEAWREDGVAHANITATSYNLDGGGTFHGRHARGTRASPTASQAGDITGGIGSRACYAAGSFQTSSPASIHWQVTETQSSTAYGMWLRFLTTPKGVTTRQERGGVTDNGTFWSHDTATYDAKLSDQTQPVADARFVASATSSASNGAAYAAVTYGTGCTPGFRGLFARGTPTSPAVPQVDDFLCFMGGHGYDGTSFTTGTKALIGFKANQTWTGSANGTYVTFETTPNGSTTRAERMRVLDSGFVGIGTTTPQKKFVVSNAGAEGLEISPSDVADTVRFLCYDRIAGAYQAMRMEASLFEWYVEGVEMARFDNTSTAGNTRLMVYDVDNATLERVTVGIADSGGAGFKVLRIPN